MHGMQNNFLYIIYNTLDPLISLRYQIHTLISAEQMSTSDCTSVPMLSHSFPTVVFAICSAQYIDASSVDTEIGDLFILLPLFVSIGSPNNWKSSSVNSSEPSTSRAGSLLHVFIRLNTFRSNLMALATTGMPSTHSFTPLFSSQLQASSKSKAPVYWSVGLGRREK